MVTLKAIVVAFVLLASAVPVRAAAQGNKQVLVLYSTRRDAQFSMLGENELPRILARGLQENLDYYSEFIDVARFPDPAYRKAVVDFLRAKYRDTRFDMVIALQDSAMEVARGELDTLFAGASHVFLSTVPFPQRPPNSTGVVLERDFASTLMLMREMQPEVRQVFVVTGAGVSDIAFERTARRQFDAAGSGLSFTYLSGLRSPDLEERLSKLPRHSAVYFLLFTQDGTGRRFHSLEYVDRVAAVANVPTYSWVDSAMGHGIVGGNLYHQRALIEVVGQLALRVLAGERPDDIPISVLRLNSAQVDWRQLQRWNIDESRVPPGTLVNFRRPTLWDEYQAYVVIAAALLVTQSSLIAGMLLQRRRRRRAEAQLSRSQRNLLKSNDRNRDLGARLLFAQDTERARIARELHDDICQRMMLLTFELETLGKSGDGHSEVAAQALATSRDISKSLHELSHRLHPTRLKLLGLVPAIEELRGELSRAGIAIAFTHDKVPPTLAPEVMLCLFRVVQETFQNAIKYANASQLSVRLNGGLGKLTLVIADNGIGFDVDAAWKKGLGLISMAERLEAIGGWLDVWSSPGRGTRVTAAVPIEVGQEVVRTAVAAL